MANSKQKILSLNDLGTVLTELHSARAKWYNIGLQLQVPVTDLQRIESEYKNDHSTCLRQMLIKWLETGSANWGALIDALQAPIVHGDENKALAQILWKKYCGEGEEETQSKNKKRKISESMNPTPEGVPSTKKPRGDLPDTLDPDNFVNSPSEDRQCVKCHQVPTNPQLSACCSTIYCKPCSKTKTYCVTHHCIIDYSDDKKLRSKIMYLQIRCPNWRGGCQFKEGVSKVYRQHLPECQIQVQSSGDSKPTATAMPLTVSPSLVKTEPTATMPTPQPFTAVGSNKPSITGSKSSSPMFGGTPKSSHFEKFSSKPSKAVKPTTHIKCKYQRIGCPRMFLSHKMMEEHLLEDVQLHLDLAIGKIEQLMDTLHQP